MADKEKKVKKKKPKEDAPAEAAAPAPAAEPEPAPAAAPAKRASSKGSKKAKRAGSSVFSMFTEFQVAEFKEGFSLMDKDKDGILGKEDLRATWDQCGKLVTDKELDEMLSEASGPINFTQLLTLFANRMSGGSDPDDVVRDAFKAFDKNGLINSEDLKHALITWGDKFTMKEVNNAFDAMDIDSQGMIDTEGLVQMLTGSGDAEEAA
ncbi:myosin regulatory light chain 2 [Cimex lectularius]|uniref:EF-hand domain-containing protein n=1 Tax=Cimex lectularius TaxID=79782 RepID=A0A8I6RZ77_CIMLE|nr:myosin regulatory light chain 2 [Cimex lectularius]